jgi:hypothetical protein
MAAAAAAQSETVGAKRMLGRGEREGEQGNAKRRAPLSYCCTEPGVFDGKCEVYSHELATQHPQIARNREQQCYRSENECTQKCTLFPRELVDVVTSFVPEINFAIPLDRKADEKIGSFTAEEIRFRSTVLANLHLLQTFHKKDFKGAQNMKSEEKVAIRAKLAPYIKTAEDIPYLLAGNRPLARFQRVITLDQAFEFLMLYPGFSGIMRLQNELDNTPFAIRMVRDALVWKRFLDTIAEIQEMFPEIVNDPRYHIALFHNCVQNVTTDKLVDVVVYLMTQSQKTFTVIEYQNATTSVTGITQSALHKWILHPLHKINLVENLRNFLAEPANFVPTKDERADVFNLFEDFNLRGTVDKLPLTLALTLLYALLQQPYLFPILDVVLELCLENPEYSYRHFGMDLFKQIDILLKTYWPQYADRIADGTWHNYISNESKNSETRLIALANGKEPDALQILLLSDDELLETPISIAYRQAVTLSGMELFVNMIDERKLEWLNTELQTEQDSLHNLRQEGKIEEKSLEGQKSLIYKIQQEIDLILAKDVKRTGGSSGIQIKGILPIKF